MKVSNHIKESMLNLMSAKLRSFLAILGVLVGTASVVALVSGGQLATEHALAQFKILGTDLLSATIQDVNHGGESSKKDVTSEDIKQAISDNQDILDFTPYAIDFSPVVYEGVKARGNLVGIQENLKPMIKIKMLHGRFISDYDSSQRFCVVGAKVAEKIIGLDRSGELIGKQIQVGKNYFTIVGVMDDTHENMFFLVDINRAVLVPLDAALSLNKYTRINNIVFKLTKEADIAKLRGDISRSFSEHFGNKKLFFKSPQEIINSMQAQMLTFTLLLGFIGSIALVVGGIGVMNIMLVSVVERRREIGIRLAVGANRRDILLMFLTESIALTLFGGLCGVMLGETAAYLIAHFSGWAFHIYTMPLVVGFGVSAMVGMFFGIYPAHKASKSDPIACLRSD